MQTANFAGNDGFTAKYTHMHMEIHAPEGPINSIKDFLVHISIVTVGILIALGLEGLRETIHNRHLVRETRESVHTEMAADQKHATIECRQVESYQQDLEALVKELPTLVQQPNLLAAKLNADSNGGYFLVANSWQAALSTGVLAHMPTAEVSAYAYGAEGIRIYTELQDKAIAQEAATKAVVMSQREPSAEGSRRMMEAMLLFENAQQHLAFVCPEMKDDIDRAYRASAP